MNAWTMAKYAVALVGLALVLGADRIGPHWIGYPGLGLIVAAFLLRYPQRRALRHPAAPPESPPPG